MATAKEKLTRLIERQPDDSSSEELLRELALALMVERGKVYENLMVDVRASNDKLRDRAARVISRLTGLSRVDAFELLGRAHGRVKHATVMHRRGVGYDEAERLLLQADGRLRAVLEGDDA